MVVSSTRHTNVRQQLDEGAQLVTMHLQFWQVGFSLTQPTLSAMSKYRCEVMQVNCLLC